MVRYRRQQQPSDVTVDPNAPLAVRKRRRGVAVLPSLFTLGNCICGFASIHYASREIPEAVTTTMVGTGAAEIDAVSSYAIAGYLISGYFIFGAMLFDLFDGFIARLTRSASDFGAELDSLADMVSFGIAPAFLSLRVISDLLHKTHLPLGMKTFDYRPGPFSDDTWGRLFWAIAALYVCCTALRLARFNVINKHEISSHLNFRGLPSPGAAAVVASTIIFFFTLYTDKHILSFNVPPTVLDFLRTVVPYLLPPVLLIAALLMVSRFAYSHLINRFLRGRKKFRVIVLYLCLLMLILWQSQISALVIIYVYALSAPTAWLYRVVTGRRPAPPVTIGPADTTSPTQTP